MCHHFCAKINLFWCCQCCRRKIRAQLNFRNASSRRLPKSVATAAKILHYISFHISLYLSLSLSLSYALSLPRDGERESCKASTHNLPWRLEQNTFHESRIYLNIAKWKKASPIPMFDKRRNGYKHTSLPTLQRYHLWHTSIRAQSLSHSLTDTLMATTSVTRLGDLLDFGQFFKAFGSN